MGLKHSYRGVNPERNGVSQPSRVRLSSSSANFADGLYEMVYSPTANALYVASAQSFKTSTAGCSINWIPQRLPRKVKPTDLKNFGMAADDNGKVYYTTNLPRDGGVPKVDVQSGKVLQRLDVWKAKTRMGDPVGAREILFRRGGQLFIGGVAGPWVYLRGLMPTP